MGQITNHPFGGKKYQTLHIFFDLSFRSQNQLEPFSSHRQHIFVQFHYVKMQSYV